MAEKLEDLNLPNASVAKIIKETLPTSVNVGKDARSALSRAASVFVLYVTSQASSEAQKVNRKTLTAQDVLTALRELEFGSFIEPLEESLKEFKETKSKKAKVKKTAEGENETEVADDNVELVDELMDDDNVE